MRANECRLLAERLHAHLAREVMLTAAMTAWHTKPNSTKLHKASRTYERLPVSFTGPLERGQSGLNWDQAAID